MSKPRILAENQIIQSKLKEWILSEHLNVLIKTLLYKFIVNMQKKNMIQ